METDQIEASTVAGIALLVIGPMLALAVFAIAQRLRTTKWAWGAAAVVTLIWFVGTAEWLPPAWKEYWGSHGISAGVITSALAIFAGWLFVSEELENRRLVALMKAWRQWVESQCTAVRQFLDDPPAPQHTVLTQKVKCAQVSEELRLQQHWVGTFFTVASLRSDNRGAELVERLAGVRDAGIHASSRLVTTRAWLDIVQAEFLDQEQNDAVWQETIAAIAQLSVALQRLREIVGQAQWDAHYRAGEAPTHPLVTDAADLAARVKPWTPT